MVTHGRDKLGPVRDDEMKKEMRDELRADQAISIEEWRETDPSGQEQPEVDWAPYTTQIAGAPPGMSPQDVETRSQLAQHLGPGVYPADRDAVVERLRSNDAPDRLVALAEELPGGTTYRNSQDLARALGLGVEDHRT